MRVAARLERLERARPAGDVRPWLLLETRDGGRYEGLDGQQYGPGDLPRLQGHNRLCLVNLRTEPVIPAEGTEEDGRIS